MVQALEHNIIEAAEFWIDAMLELLTDLTEQLGCRGTPVDLLNDLQQFRALSEYLQMAASTRPANSWEAYHWTTDFSFFLSQLLRRSERLFEHLAAYPETGRCKIDPALVADLFRFMRLANRLPNLY